jgi:O-acetyl-ADP-ribose deacetylase (regulator of RNase III)
MIAMEKQLNSDLDFRMLNYIDANITSAKEGLIIQGVNCQGKMATGLAKHIRFKWPVVYEQYSEYCEGKSPADLLGTWHPVKVTDDVDVINLFSQTYYGYDAKRYATTSAIRKGLYDLFSILVEAEWEKPVNSAKIGCGLGGLDWESEVKPIFEDIIYELQPQFPINIYDWSK